MCFPDWPKMSVCTAATDNGDGLPEVLTDTRPGDHSLSVGVSTCKSNTQAKLPPVPHPSPWQETDVISRVTARSGHSWPSSGHGDGYNEENHEVTGMCPGGDEK